MANRKISAKAGKIWMEYGALQYAGAASPLLRARTSRRRLFREYACGMTWLTWLILAVIIAVVAAVMGQAKGTRNVAGTRLMGVGRIVLLIIVAIIAYAAYRARSGG